MFLTSQSAFRVVKQELYKSLSKSGRCHGAKTMTDTKTHRHYLGSTSRGRPKKGVRKPVFRAMNHPVSVDEQDEESLRNQFGSDLKNEWLRIYSASTACLLAEGMYKVLHNKAVVLEANAGLGFVSKCLLSKGLTNLVALEPDDVFNPTLEQVKNQYKDSFHVLDCSIEDVLYHNTLDFPDELSKEIIHKVGNSVQIVGVLQSWSQLALLIYHMRTERSFLCGKNVNMCICLPERAWLEFADTKKYRRFVVDRLLFHIIFKTEVLDTFSAEPFFRSNFRKKKEVNMALVQICSRKIDFDLTEMHFFLSEFHNYKSRLRYVIPTLEKWSPDCGEDLIKMGISIYTKFYDLSIDELLKVFEHFRNFPNYLILSREQDVE